MRNRLLLTALAAATACSSGKATTAATPAPAATTSATSKPALFSDAQATRGLTVYQNTCAACHSTTQYTSDTFKQTWHSRPVFDLVDYIRTTMPEDKPASLTKAQYLDVTAYLLKINGMPAGKDQLPSEDADLKKIKIDIKP